MALPPLRADGSLPPGLHRIAHLSEVFAAFPATTPQRQALDAELTRFVDVVQRFRLGAEVGLGGSYITSKATPSDLDLTLYAPGLIESDVELRLQAEGLDLAKTFDLWVESDRVKFEEWVDLFSTDRNGDPIGVVMFTM